MLDSGGAFGLEQCATGVLLGGYIGFLNNLLLLWTVSRLQPVSAGRAWRWVMGGVYFRWGFTALFLMLMLRQGAGVALSAFLGLSLARWAFVVYVQRRGVPKWFLSDQLESVNK